MFDKFVTVNVRKVISGDRQKNVTVLFAAGLKLPELNKGPCHLFVFAFKYNFCECGPCTCVYILAKGIQVRVIKLGTILLGFS